MSFLTAGFNSPFIVFAAAFFSRKEQARPVYNIKTPEKPVYDIDHLLYCLSRGSVRAAVQTESSAGMPD